MTLLTITPPAQSLADPLEELRLKWQHLLDVLQSVTGVPAALVMRTHPGEIEVFTRSSNPDNAYKAREHIALGAGLYCEQVLRTRAELLVPDATVDPDWDHNPDLEIGLVSYLGLPVAWPSGELFGTICILDSKPNRYTAVYRGLLEQFRGAVELDLAAVVREEDLRRSRDAVERQREALVRANSELETFAQLASHDLSEPLRAVGWFVTLLLEHVGDQADDEAHRYADFIIDATSRMRQLIDDLLAYARVGGDGATDATAALDDVAAETVSLLGPVIADAHATVHVDRLPRVRASSDEMALLLRNLITNALKFARTGVPPQVRIQAVRCDDRMWEVQVDDNGIGIDAADREIVFRVFQRLHPRQDYPGTGVGLSICEKIVEGLGGRIWVEDSPLGGAGLRFTVPAAVMTTGPSPG